MTRNKHDFYPTPYSIVDAVVGVLQREMQWKDEKLWECCAGDMRFVNAMSDLGDVVATDIKTNQNFFWYKEALAPVVVTNPPFNCIREFIDHAFAIGVQKMALVCPERLWACARGYSQFQRHKPSYWYQMSWREDYLGKGGKPDRALALAVWNTPNAEDCKYRILDKPIKQGDIEHEIHRRDTRQEEDQVRVVSVSNR